jgi:hypothetical protein
MYDYGNLTTAARTYTNTYENSSFYITQNIYNRLKTTTVTNGTQTYTLVTNGHDTTYPQDAPNVRQHDANYNTGFFVRGNLTSTTPLGSPTVTLTRDITGNVVTASDGLGHTVSPTIDTTTNYVVPSVMRHK